MKIKLTQEEKFLLGQMVLHEQISWELYGDKKSPQFEKYEKILHKLFNKLTPPKKK